MAMCLIDMHFEIIHDDEAEEKRKKWPGVWKFFNMLEMGFGFIEKKRERESTQRDAEFLSIERIDLLRDSCIVNSESMEANRKSRIELNSNDNFSRLTRKESIQQNANIQNNCNTMQCGNMLT